MDKTGFTGLLERKFKLAENKTNVRTEIVAGTALFLASVAYPLLTANILGDAGMDSTAVFVASTFMLIITGLLYALWVNYPFICGPSIGVSPWIAYTVILQLGVPWQTAMFCTFVSGTLFILLSLFGFREKILGAIPKGLRYAFSGGIGAFITLVGLINSGIVSVDPASAFGLSLGDLTSAATVLGLITFFLIAVLYVKKIKGSFLIGIVFYTVVGFFITDPSTGLKLTTLPQGEVFNLVNPISALAPTFGKMNLSMGIQAMDNGWVSIAIIIFTIFFIDVFDTVGTLSGLTTLAGYADEDGNIPKLSRCFLVDAIGTVVGALLGTSMVTTYCESSIGVAEGGRTGLTSLWASILFAFSLILAPIVSLVSSVACGVAVALIGPMMLSSVLKVNFDDFSEALPAFFCIFMMPFTGNMGVGILCGVFIFTIVKSFKGKESRKEVNPLLWVLSGMFVVYVIAQKFI